MSMRESVAEAYQRLGGNVSAVARELGIHRSSVRHHLRKTPGLADKPLAGGKVKARANERRKTPSRGVRRYILTSAQNNTLVNERAWENLLALAGHYKAEILVGTYSYNTNAYGSLAVKRGTRHAQQFEPWYDERLLPYIEAGDNRNIELAPGLVWCGRANILPTAERPLSGFETYTGRASGIFPHAKLAMQSIASGKMEATKFNYTTGTITAINYIQKKAGLKAEHHHTYGALLVEVDSSGSWWVRQLNADGRGVIYDLDLRAEGGEVTAGHSVEGINWGDIHTATIDQEIAEVAWGEGGMMDTLRPRYQFMHDILDFRARNGHTAKKNLIHDRFQAFCQGHDSVEEEIRGVATFLEQTSRDFCQTVVVDSNHDNFLMEWLRIGDYRSDPVNAVYFLEAQLHAYKSIAADPSRQPHMLRWAVERILGKRAGIRFLDEDESFVICKDAAGGIECGMHGHLGPNGARGSASNLSRMGRKLNRGHEHSASIHDGVYTSGVTGSLDQGYNRGPSSWSHSHIVTYKNGKRAIITVWKGKWRA